MINDEGERWLKTQLGSVKNDLRLECHVHPDDTRLQSIFLKVQSIIANLED